MPTIKQCLEQIIIPPLEAELLLARSLQCPRAHLLAYPEYLLSEDQQCSYESMFARRSQGEPIAYILGEREFWSLPLSITPDVLIPRHETELLVELILRQFQKDAPCTIADLGTGSGAIALALASERPLWKIIATDFSATALQVAKDNAAKFSLDNIEFYQGDWCTALPDTHFDCLASNPPYLAESDHHLEQGDLRFEPKLALCAPENGLAAYRLIAKNAGYFLKPGGHLFLEHGSEQGKAVQEILLEQGYLNVKTFHDLAERPRVTAGLNSAVCL